MGKIMNLRSLIAVSGLIGLVAIAPAMGKDFRVLTRVLSAADLADQATAFCTLMNSKFPSETGGTLGDMHFYEQHIKLEVIYRLSESEAVSVLKSAADLAKAEMLGVLGTIRSGDAENETALATAWCDKTAKPLVRAVISTHDHHHKEIDELLERAKIDAVR